jgi:hypothetical protein
MRANARSLAAADRSFSKTTGGIVLPFDSFHRTCFHEYKKILQPPDAQHFQFEQDLFNRFLEWIGR